MKVAVASENFLGCNVENLTHKNACITDIAFNTKNQTVCLEIENEDIRDDCFIAVKYY